MLVVPFVRRDSARADQCLRPGQTAAVAVALVAVAHVPATVLRRLRILLRGHLTQPLGAWAVRVAAVADEPHETPSRYSKAVPLPRSMMSCAL